jgi:hypothetical protein
MALSMAQESPEQIIVRLERELVHVTEQCRVAHNMAMHWKERCLASEERCQYLEQKLDRRNRLAAPEGAAPTPEPEALGEYEEFVLSMA